MKEVKCGEIDKAKQQAELKTVRLQRAASIECQNWETSVQIDQVFNSARILKSTDTEAQEKSSSMTGQIDKQMKPTVDFLS